MIVTFIQGENDQFMLRLTKYRRQHICSNIKMLDFRSFRAPCINRNRSKITQKKDLRKLCHLCVVSKEETDEEIETLQFRLFEAHKRIKCTAQHLPLVPNPLH